MCVFVMLSWTKLIIVKLYITLTAAETMLVILWISLQNDKQTRASYLHAKEWKTSFLNLIIWPHISAKVEGRFNIVIEPLGTQ